MVEIVGQYTDLRKAGANYSGRCPFHEERTPSFSVNPTEKLYYCFGCGAGGNLFGFVQEKESLDFAGAVEYLADRYGIALEYEETSARGDAERRRKRAPALPARAGDRLLRARARATPTRPSRRASTSPAAASARRSAGSSASASACRAGTSCATRPGRRSSPTRTCSTPAWSCPASRGARTTAFAGASCSRSPTTAAARSASAPAPWATRSPSTSTRRRRRCTTRARRSSACTPPRRRPRARTASTSSRATPTSSPWCRPACTTSSPAWARRSPSSSSAASRGVTRNLYLCFDADAAGIGAMSRALTLGRKMGLSLHVVRVPDGLDPADYVLSGAGGDGFRALAADAQTLLQFHVRLALAAHDLDKPDGRARAFAQLRGVLSEAATPIERDEELRYVADRLQLSAESVRYLLAGSGALRGGRRSRRRGPPRAAAGRRARAAPSAAPTSSRCAFSPAVWRSPTRAAPCWPASTRASSRTAETRDALGAVKERLEL